MISDIEMSCLILVCIKIPHINVLRRFIAFICKRWLWWDITKRFIVAGKPDQCHTQVHDYHHITPWTSSDTGGSPHPYGPFIRFVGFGTLSRRIYMRKDVAPDEDYLHKVNSWPQWKSCAKVKGIYFVCRRVLWWQHIFQFGFSTKNCL